MQPRLHVVALVFSILVILAILELIRRGRLREEYALIWLFSAVSLFFITAFNGTLRFLADLLQIEYAPSLIFMVSIVFLMAIVLAQTMAISKLTGHIRDLAQKYSILELDLHNQTEQALQITTGGLSESAYQYIQWFTRDLKQYNQPADWMRRALEVTAACFNTPNGSLIVLDPVGHMFRNTVICQGEFISGDKGLLDETVRGGLSGWVLTNRLPTLVSSTLDDTRWLKRPWEASKGGSRSAMSVPLEFKGQVLGVLTLVYPQAGRFTQEDLVFLNAVAGVIAMVGKEILSSIENENAASPMDTVSVDQLSSFS